MSMEIGRFEDTIAAISTPPGRSGIGIVRLSGPQAIAIAAAVFRPASRKRNPLEQVSFTTCYGHVLAGEYVVDEVILTVMRAPHTYTTQDVAEINCHGGIVPLRRTLELVIEAGARLADPGEFTKRAYYFGRIDLAQAEAVADIINAQTNESQKAAMAQLAGRLSDEINSFRESIVSTLARIEAAIDFSDQDIELISAEEISAAIEKLRGQIRALLATAEHGRILREGLKVAIVGRPNVGKSSLLNALLQTRRAIVTDVPGTTRDVIEDTMNVNGIAVTLADTAGLVETDDVVEAEGVSRSRQAICDADLVLLVIDSSEALEGDDRELLAELPSSSIVVMNKEDLPTGSDAGEIAQITPAPIVWVSALEGTHIGELENAISSHVWEGKTRAGEQTIVTNVRHKAALQEAEASLAAAAEAVADGYSEEFVAADLRDALSSLDEIVGKYLPEDIINRIFAEFCIGK
jgi:tRNA modification GTPase